MTSLINRQILISNASHFTSTGLNPLSSLNKPIDSELAQAEHSSIRDALKVAGVEIMQVSAPTNCPDGVYTANWGLCIGSTVVFARLPKPRAAEEAYVKHTFETDELLLNRFKRQIEAPYLFSGQGDALPCGNYLFCGQGYRTDPRMHKFLAETFPDKQIISLHTIPQLGPNGEPVINPITGLYDSFFYDLDLALSILGNNMIAWCPDAFTPASQNTIRQIPDLIKIEVSLHEATSSFACNLISTGKTVIMSATAPEFKAKIEAAGLRTITPPITELAEGGGYIRCVGLTLSN